MEDRINSGLLFVMIDRATDRARSEWDERLRALPGVARISWWKNVQLNRRDWLGELRTMEDFEILGICEIDDVIDPPISSVAGCFAPADAGPVGGDDFDAEPEGRGCRSKPA
jgi:hypothetical protein